MSDATNDISSLHNNDVDDDDEEEECRVCRGPAEEGRPLFHPCICSGSIGLIHQDCLQSWLRVQPRGSLDGNSGSCELCKTKFRFAPQYADNTPQKLSWRLIVHGLVRRFVVRWLPFTIRSILAICLWILLAPLITAYLYHGWMARPSIVLHRMMSSKLVITDLISGGVIACCIIISFLSLMSFADFLRVEIQNQQRNGGNGGMQQRQLIQRVRRRQQQQQNGGIVAAAIAAANDEDEDENDENEIDDGIYNEVQHRLNRRTYIRGLNARLRPINDTNIGTSNNDSNMINNDRNPDEIDVDEDDDDDSEHDEDYEDSDEIDESWESTMYDNELEDVDDEEEENDELFFHPFLNVNGNNNNANDMDPLYFHPAAVNDGFMGINAGDDDDDNGNQRVLDRENQEQVINDIPIHPRHQERRQEVEEPRGRLRQVGVANNNDGDVFGFLDQEEPLDMDINIALDELLGIRGPLLVVVRNLLWLVAFNAAYLGFFAFIPRTIGIAMSSMVFNTTKIANSSSIEDSIDVTAFDGNATANVLRSFLNSTGGNFTFGSMLKYIEEVSVHHETAFRLHDFATIGLGYLSIAVSVVVFRYMWILSIKIRSFRRAISHRNNPAENYNIAEAFQEIRRIVQDLGNGDPIAVANQGEPADVDVSAALGVAIDVTVAVVKVGVLLFLKMFLLPLLLGIALDASTMSLFGSTLDDRLIYAGQDVFSFMLLHWVAGISFMLIVTVSVLQLREVAHPDLLSQVIRPQEPQPDLLGNLMNESVSTHSKRMILSLIIYFFLLAIHIYVPVRYGISQLINERWKNFFQLKFCYIMPPQLQVPLELLFFHLCMLALLEKYKNGLGGMQHQWLRFMSNLMGISDCMLPHSVRSFCLVGVRPVFITNRKIDPFWYNLARNDSTITNNLESNFTPLFRVRTSVGESKSSGERVVIRGADYIRLPSQKNGVNGEEVLLPTKFGRFRLKRDESANTIHLWEEKLGEPISRPPEGWDDLGAGGADVQGRWAWGTEKKSKIENSVGSRHPFFDKSQSVAESLLVLMKLLLLAILSWVVISAVLFVVATTPMFTGRSLYYILRVPTKWVHDPMAFGLGFTIIFPVTRKTVKLLVKSNQPFHSRLLCWIGLFHMPPIRKTFILLASVVLWFGVAPLLLGLSYDIGFIKSNDWFEGKEPTFDLRSIYWAWMGGTVLIYVWSELCIVSALSQTCRIFANDGPPRPNENGDRAAIQDRNSSSLSWQGKGGRIARFWESLKCIIQMWEWEKVDEVLLLHDCCLPIVIELFNVLLVPLLLYGICFLWFPTQSTISRAFIVRSGLALKCVVRVCRMWKDQIRNCFNLAHKTARDDLYLIGEILLNYGES